MKKNVIILFLVVILMQVNVSDIKSQDAHRGGLFENWAIGIDLISTYGSGIYVATSLSPNIKTRVGFDYLSLNYNNSIDFTAPISNIPGNAANYDVDMNGELSNLKLKFPNFKILLDYYPVTDGIFCITGGIYIGNNRITADGLIKNYDSYISLLEEYGENLKPEFEFEDVVIRPNENGSFNAKLKMGNTVKPYFGIGLGRTISKSRVGFRFDLGMVYQGKFQIESDNVVKGIKTADELAADIDLPFSKKLLEWWPMVSFSLSYRIK